MKALKIIIGALAGAGLGLVIGYMGGVLVFCSWLYPESNLCGLVAVFVTGPAGLLIGLVAGIVLAVRWGSGPPPTAP